jgi:cyclic pyranopterin phosphate synthase
MPKETYGDDYRFLPTSDYLTFPEIARVVRAAAAMGVSKVRLTGGEPLLRPGLAELVAQLAQIEPITDLALTTNGFLLAEHAAQLHAAGLQRVTVSLDSVDPQVFAAMNGLGMPLARVLGGIQAALEVGLTPLKLNAVIQRGVNDHTAVDLIRHFHGTGVVVRFIEYMDVGNRNQWENQLVVPSADLMKTISSEFALEPVAAAYSGEVAGRYRLSDGGGEIGFISSISQPFCGDCTRARLSTDGKLYTCLFSGLGTDVSAALRGDGDDEDDGKIRDVMQTIWSNRDDRYSEERSAVAAFAARRREKKVEMYQIGG